MLNYKHILFATDLSTASQSLITSVNSLAQRTNAILSIAHVIEYTTAVYGGGEFAILLDDTLQRTLIKQAKNTLTKLGTQLKVTADNQFILQGSIKHKIINLANELHVDLIIIGKHAHYGIEKMLGATANAILHAAKCDVLALRI